MRSRFHSELLAIGRAALAAAALSVAIPAGATDGGPYRYQVELTLEVGKRSFVDEAGYDVSFVEVLEDARCPADVECALAGNARILVRLVPGMGPFYDLELDTSPILQTEAFLSDGTGIRLLDLQPLPTASAASDPEGYSATLIIFERAD